MQYEYTDMKRQLSSTVIEILDIIQDEGFIAGGTARYYASSLTNEPSPNDIDVYVKEKKFFHSIVSRLERRGWNRKDDRRFSIRFAKKIHGKEHVVELIKPFNNEFLRTYGPPMIVIDRFDFTVAKAALDHDSALKGKILVARDFLVDNRKGLLRISTQKTSLRSPITVMVRLMQYVRNGYHISIYELIVILRCYMAHPCFCLNFWMYELKHRRHAKVTLGPR